MLGEFNVPSLPWCFLHLSQYDGSCWEKVTIFPVVYDNRLPSDSDYSLPASEYMK